VSQQTSHISRQELTHARPLHNLPNTMLLQLLQLLLALNDPLHMLLGE
jgi:hypothetical protein